MIFLAGLNWKGHPLDIFCDRKNLQGVPRKIFLPKLLPGETLCKIVQIFPPKDLVYRGKLLSHFLIK